MLCPYIHNIIYLSYRNVRVRFFFRLRALLIFAFSFGPNLYTYPCRFNNMSACVHHHLHLCWLCIARARAVANTQVYIFNKTGGFTEVRTPTHFPSYNILHYIAYEIYYSINQSNCSKPLIFGHTYICSSI